MRATRDILLATILLWALLPQEGAAATIFCVDARLDTDSWVSKRLQKADVVLLGRVISAATAPRRPPELKDEVAAGSMAELLEMIEKGQSQATDYTTHHWQQVSLKVLKIWKGPPSRIFYVKNEVRSGQYGAPLMIGETYLVFGYKREEQIYVISTVCDDTKTEDDAADRIRILDKLA